MRIIRSDDYAEEIQALDALCFRPQDAEPVGLDGDRDVWVALDGDTVVGYLVAQAHQAGPDRHADGSARAYTRHYLDRYGVHPEHAGRGIGKRLCRAWLRHAAKRPGWAWTYTYSHNAQSANALIHMGFRAWQTRQVPATLGDPGGYAPMERFCMWRRVIA